MEYKTVKYINDAKGISQKNQDAARGAIQGWRIYSESIEPGKFKGGKACCLASICLPLGAAAGSSEGFIVVTYSKEEKVEEKVDQSPLEFKKCPACAEVIKVEAIKCRYCQEEFDPKEVERLIEDRRKELAAIKAINEAEEAERLLKVQEGKKKCPQCGNWDVYQTLLKDDGMGDYCPHCKKSLKSMGS